MHLEDPLVGACLLRDDLGVGAWLITAAAASGGRRSGLVTTPGVLRLLRWLLRRGRWPILRPDRIVRRDHRLGLALREQPGSSAGRERKHGDESKSGRKQPAVRRHKRLLAGSEERQSLTSDPVS